MKKIFVIVLFVILCISQVGATDYYVDATTGNNSTGDGTSGNPWQTITYALSQISGTGHTLYVAAGTYDPSLGETFPILMKNGVSLVGAGIDISILDANSTNRVLECISIVDASTRLEGFTITGGENVTYAAGLNISAGSTLSVIGNKVTGNITCCGSAGIYVTNSSPVILNNIIIANSSNNSPTYGTGISVSDGSPLIEGNLITENGSNCSVHIYGSSSSPKITYNVITNNSGDGIYCTSSSNPKIINNTISDNNSNGINTSSLIDSIFNNIISLNSGYGIRESGSASDPGKVWYNLFYANTSGLYYDEGTTDYYTASSLNTGVAECENNIDGDPMFVDRVNGDYRLMLGSPAIDAGDPDPQFNDPDGSRNDIGAFVFDKPPAAPQNLSATAGDEKITLRWNPNTEPDLDQYNIYRDLSSPAITLVDSVISTSPPDTFYVDIGLVIGQDYYYRIKALDTARNESDFSDEVIIAIPFDLYTDSLALIALYDSTDGVNWTDNTNWLTGPVSSWFGITVSGSRVTEIHFDCNNLNGPIPPEIGNLTNLTFLSLEEVELSGQIPTEIGNLTNLTTLRLYNSQLSGSIPSEIGNLTNLTFLDFNNNQLTGLIPLEIGNLTSLTTLHLYDNQLTGEIPSEIGALINLTALELQGNQLSGSIPPEIGNLTNLGNLYFDSNQLTGSIPIEIGNLTNLGNLNLCSNQLSGSIPPEIGNLTNLENLCFGSNQLSGLIPPEIGNLTNLTYLNLGCNQFTGSIPSEIGNLSNLEHWELYSNQLSGAVPNEIGNLTNLQFLYIHNNHLTELPDLSSLGSLLCLEIRDNKFTFKDIEPNIGITGFVYSPQDSVGETIDTTAYIETNFTLSVSTGGASSQYQWKKGGANIGSISADSTFTINTVAFSDSGTYSCEITNTVATELTLYSRPVNVTVDYTPFYKDSIALVALYDSTDGVNWTDNTNWLTGPVSSWFGITVSGGRVTEINLTNNNLTGTISAEIGNLTNLENLVLSYNQFSGPIPLEIGNLTNLTGLDLNSNQLTSSIPIEIGNLVNLTYLHLYCNQLSGSIPAEIGNLTSLQNLHLRENQLIGSIPIEIGNLTNLTFLGLEDNQLSGSIPSEIGNLVNLTQLQLNNNNLSGSIPSEIGNLINLTNLWLQVNQLSGTVPIEIWNLSSMYNLQLFHNQLSGTIPPEIGNMSNLVFLNLHDNQFTGLANLSLLGSLDELTIENNKFTFEDIEPNIGVPSTTFTYSPQDSVGVAQDTTVNPCTSFTVSVSVGGSNNIYQWQKDGTNIMDTDSSAYIMSFITPSDSGTYICEITNTIATELTLYSRPINVNVGPVLNITSEYSDTICLNSNNGYIDISVTGGTSPYFYTWSNGSTNEDVYDLEADEYSVTVSDYYNCIEIETITIASTSPCPTEEICMVTVDNSNMNLIIWEKTQYEGIVLYKIYRETVNDGIYELIGTVPFEDLSVFVDSTSNPGQSSYKYKLSIIDTCGIVSEKSYYHGTMLLQVSVGTSANNLDWNNYEYEGGDFNFSKFYIYRGSTQDNLQKIDSLEANYFTYTDSDPPDGLLYYQVAGVKPDACFPTTNKKSISDENYTLSFTNIFNYGVTRLDNINYSNKIKIYPNPFTNKTTIEFPNPKFDSYTLIITNISGTTVKIIKNIKTGKVELERGSLQEGLYLIELRGDKIYKGRFIIN